LVFHDLGLGEVLSVACEIVFWDEMLVKRFGFVEMAGV